MDQNTEKAPVQGQSEGATPVAPVDQKTTKVAKVAKVKTESEARAEAFQKLMSTGTLHEIVLLLAIDALVVGGVYAAVRAIGHKVCVAYDIEVGWLVHLIEGAISGAVGVPAAILANKGISALSAQQTYRGLELLRKDLQDQNQESTSRLLAKVQDDNKARNEQAIAGLRGDLDAALERIAGLSAANEELGGAIGTTLGRVYAVEASVAKANDVATVATPALEIETNEDGVVTKFSAAELPLVKNLKVKPTTKNGRKTGTK